MMIKLCGLRTMEAARAARELEVDFVGLNLVPGRRRQVSLSDAKEMISELGSVEPVGVFMSQSVQEIHEIATALELEWIQLHGQITQEMLRNLRPRFQIITAIPVDESFPPKNLSVISDHAEMLLFDAPNPGSGTPFDKSLFRPGQVSKPFFIAGGLDADNVASAISQISPDGVDTASGIETNGQVDPQRMQAFVAAVRGV
jgi:phosphoribosylanthranilate isomerase